MREHDGALDTRINYQNGGTVRPEVAGHATSTHLKILGFGPFSGRLFDAAEGRVGAGVVAVAGRLAYKSWFR